MGVMGGLLVLCNIVMLVILATDEIRSAAKTAKYLAYWFVAAMILCGITLVAALVTWLG